MIAALPMYDRPEIRDATDRYWALIRDRLARAGVAAPAMLTRGQDDLMAQWLHPDLVLSQACGFPYRARLHGQVQLVGTPDFGVQGCAPGYYRSVLIARVDDRRDGVEAFRGARLAYNDAMSQSGWAAPMTLSDETGLHLVAGPRTGSHGASLAAVATGETDLAALDAVTWGLLQRFDARAAQVRVVGMTPPTPGLPYVTAAGQDAGAVFDAVAGAIAALAPDDRAALGLRGIVRIPAADYLAVPTPATP